MEGDKTQDQFAMGKQQKMQLPGYLSGHADMYDRRLQSKFHDKDLDYSTKKQKTALMHELNEIKPTSAFPGPTPSMFGGNKMIYNQQMMGSKLGSTYQLQADDDERGRANLHKIMEGISKPAIRRMARRGGVKRISGKMHFEARHAMGKFMTKVLRDCMVYMAHGKRNTVRPRDIVNSLKRHGRTIYGYGN
ncbi:unnamed protein product [Amoebophrya sp. A25]|nr:unnamed protein product [Amoebophrya sp. A25]|eukprot:GSA25T00005689001.1